jgi:NAD(P)-dependent dehydrogenase (short-subunit alcohol dehydrogenase family)
VKPVVLITDAQTPLGVQLVRRYLDGGYRVAAARSDRGRPESHLSAGEDTFLLIDWDRKSFISTKNLLLGALNRFDGLDEALLLLAPELEKKLLPEMAVETIDRAVDAWIKGTLFLLKGVLELFARGQRGRLALVDHVQQEAAGVLPPLDSALRASFCATASALFASNVHSGVFMNGFACRKGKTEQFADFIFQTMKERGGRVSGRWFCFPSRRRLRSIFTPGLRV